ncbi:MAG: ATPase, T2SS/T4P/T4SS family [Spirochaetota bacterium]|mgnify:FL=1|uniref:ATPase, T2SS/T4P/T4SS family n=1 Tax=Candidatus Avelusimicrobium faecicola TaxID=3416205 RepID=UPI002A610E18|nr:Flp pilus assembly complex ATPase component TadA [Spirochaetota bacterium]MDE3277356.1 ATPase, T2SS/T4P/T4SS family [Spirochaetota bacterium]MDY2939581.1 ATPase, T2SS/T4P/T4SS family [Elusimicrobiaceae bacterium]MDY6128382.1 ATPase, T2SS/T4P/T4SS family [Elusimicrobiaceae bacterium]
MADMENTFKTEPKIITFTGPKEGAGKTTLVLNLALGWAGIQKRPVLIVPLDPLARQEHSFYLNIKKPVSVADILKTLGNTNIAVVGGLLRGKISMSQWGVGVLPLGNTRTQVATMSPKILIPILSRLSQTFDIFLDVDSSFPMQAFAFDISDKVFWVTNATRSHLNSTVQLFNDYKEQRYALDRISVICNAYDTPGSIPYEEMERVYQSLLGRNIDVFLPWDEGIMASSNRREVEIIVNPQSEWIKGLRLILAQIRDLHPAPKDWTAEVSDEEFTQAAKEIWSPVLFNGGETQGAESHFAPEGADNGGEANKTKLSFWDDLKQKVHKDVVRTLEIERIVISDESSASEQTRKRVAAIVDDILQKQPNLQFSREQRTRFSSELLDEILGLGPLENLMRDASVTEIMVNAFDKIFIEQKGKLTLTKYKFRNNEQVVQVIKRIVSPLGRRIDESVPLVDARLKDGSRVNAIIAPLAVSGPTLTIRRFSQKPFGPEDYFRFGTISRECMDFLEKCVRIRKNIIVCGGTGTGKTTFLNALSGYISHNERIITVEDTAELRLQQPHWVSLESRPPNVEGKGAITIQDLVKNCLRMRPDRIVVGECRGGEALDMLQAMNTGHEGSLTTIHANTPRDGLSRLEAMCMQTGADLPIFAIREMISSAVNMIVQLSRFSDGSRKVTYITEMTGQKDGAIQSVDLFRYVQTGVDDNGKVQGFFAPTGHLPSFFTDFKAKGVPLPEETFTKNAVSFDEAGKPILSAAQAAAGGPVVPPPPPGVK